MHVQKHPKPLRLLKYRFKAMGTPCELQCYVASENEGKRVAELMEADVLRLEQRYSRYRDDSLLSEINRVALAGGEISVDAETAQLLDYAQTCYLQSDGLFDITSGVLRRAWRFRDGVLPEQGQIDELLEIVGWHKLEWRSPLLRFNVPGMEIDLGGVVKEYAADRAAVICQNAGVRHGCVNLGGDIRIIGPHPDGSPWIVGIQHPRMEMGEVLGNLEMFEGGMATSGDYERCIVVGKERYSHILNPKTGWPVKHLATVTVAANFCLIAGSASTIAMLKEKDGPAWLAELGMPHFWMDNNGKTGMME
jgi:thiamine biosynthesis lipoprotein